MSDMNYLRVGLRSIQLKDSSAFRALMFEGYLKKFPLLSRCLSSLPSVVITLLMFCRFSSYVLRGRWTREDAEMAYVAQYENEKRVLEKFCRNNTQIYGSYCYGQFSVKNLFLLMGTPPKFFKIIRYASFARKQFSLLVVLRQLEFIFHYSFHLKNLKKKSGMYVCSTESNPEVIGMVLAASKKGAQTTYLNHGFLNKELGVFFHNILVVDSEALKQRVQVFSLKKSLIKTQLNTTIDPIFNFDVKLILVVGSIIPALDQLEGLWDKLSILFPRARVVYRPHPNNLLKRPEVIIFEQKLRGGFPLRSLEDDFYGVDLVIGGETSCLLDALKNGKLATHARVDVIPYDHYGFVESGLVPILGTSEDIRRHYQSPTWKNVAKTYGLI